MTTNHKKEQFLHRTRYCYVSVCPMLRCHGYIGWNTSKIISWLIA